MSDLELSAKLDRWIDDNTVDNDFIAHPDFVYDKLLELETEIKKLQAENAELKRRQLKDGDIAKVVNGVRLAISEVWGNPPQSLREIVSRAVIRNLPTPPEGE